jgi:hypothetical protein
MEFYPHDCQGKEIYSLHQSAKWREELCRETRVQMVASRSKHYYIFEPVTLVGPEQKIMIPIFFFKLNNELYAKCIVPKMKNFPTTELRNNHPQIQLMIPQFLYYESTQLINIPVKMFDLMCSEMKWGDGTPFLDKIRRQLVGKCVKLKKSLYNKNNQN